MIIGSGKSAALCASQYEEEPCGRPAVHYPCGIPVCGDHLDALTRELAEQAATRAVRTITVSRGMDAVVYYAGHPQSQTVKVGTSTKLSGRIQSLRTSHPGLVLLAAEPGHYRLEAARHAQFSRWAVAGEREWFHKSPEIMEHINALRIKHGDPWSVGRHGQPRRLLAQPPLPPDTQSATPRPRSRHNPTPPAARHPRWVETAAKVIAMASASYTDSAIAEWLGLTPGEVNLIISECRAQPSGHP